jgi:hypothetical protein
MDVSGLSQLFTKTIFELIVSLNLLNDYDKSKYGKWHLKKLVRKVKIRRSYVLNLLKSTHVYLNCRNPKRKKISEYELIKKITKEHYPHAELNDIVRIIRDARFLPHIYNKRMEKLEKERKEMRKQWYKKTNFTEKRAILRKKDKEKCALNCLHCIDINFRK